MDCVSAQVFCVSRQMLCVSVHRLKAVGCLWWVWGLGNTSRVSRGIGWGIISTDHVMVGTGDDTVAEGRWPLAVGRWLLVVGGWLLVVG